MIMRKKKRRKKEGYAISREDEREREKDIGSVVSFDKKRDLS